MGGAARWLAAREHAAPAKRGRHELLPTDDAHCADNFCPTHSQEYSPTRESASPTRSRAPTTRGHSEPNSAPLKPRIVPTATRAGKMQNPLTHSQLEAIAQWDPKDTEDAVWVMFKVLECSEA